MERRNRVRSPWETIRRATLVASRYGLTATKITDRTNEMIRFLDGREVIPTIPVPAVVLERHARVMHILEKSELAVHGYRHVAYSDLSEAGQEADLAAAMEAFDALGKTPRGFRSPYLRPGPRTMELLHRHGMLYDSSESRFILPQEHPIYSKAIPLARVRYNGGTSVSLWSQAKPAPVELAVSLPDDEILVDSLGIKNESTLEHVFQSMLNVIRKSGELLVFQVHPERFHVCRAALKSVIAQAADDGAWLAPLVEIAGALAAEGSSRRWPHGEPYAVAVTGDLDALDMSDFPARVFGG